MGMAFGSCLLSVVRCEKGMDEKIAEALNSYRFWHPDTFAFSIDLRDIYFT
jgi:hypothetical protein